MQGKKISFTILNFKLILSATPLTDNIHVTLTLKMTYTKAVKTYNCNQQSSKGPHSSR